MIITKHSDWLAARAGDEMLMMSAHSDHYLGLNEVGARVWELLEAPQDIGALCAQLLCEFDVAPDVCRTDVEALLKELAKEGVVTLDPPPAA